MCIRDRIYPASTAKLMTAIVCVEKGNVNSVIKTKSDVVYRTTPGTYSLGIGAGVKYTFKDLLHMSLMSVSYTHLDVYKRQELDLLVITDVVSLL